MTTCSITTINIISHTQLFRDHFCDTRLTAVLVRFNTRLMQSRFVLPRPFTVNTDSYSRDDPLTILLWGANVCLDKI